LGSACKDFVERVKEIRENEYMQYLRAVRRAVNKALEDLGLGGELGTLVLHAALEREMEALTREMGFLDLQLSRMPPALYREGLTHEVETLLHEFSRQELRTAITEAQNRELRRRGERMWRAVLESGELHFLFVDVGLHLWRHRMPSNAEIRRIFKHMGLSQDNTIVAAPMRRRGMEEHRLVICGEQGHPEELPAFSSCLGGPKESVKLKLYLHDVRRVLKEEPSSSIRSAGPRGLYEYQHLSAYLGKMEFESHGRPWHLDELVTREYFSTWLRECWKRLREKSELTEEEAQRILKDLAEGFEQAERRSLELLRSTVGSEAVDQLLKLGYLIVDSANGRKYRVTRDGGVFDVVTGREVCVMVDTEKELPLYDEILAKYLVIRDHPDQIDTLEPEEDEFGEVPQDLLEEICARGGIKMKELVERVERAQAELAYQVTRLGAVLLVAKELGVKLGREQSGESTNLSSVTK
jgi:uncharacterized protein YbjQ (UPF0145 family)